MYELVDEAETKKYRKECSFVLKKTCAILKRKGISAQFTLVGSGARNMITRNGKGPFDLDYNLEIILAPDELWKDLYRLKETVRVALNKANGFDFSDAKDSTSVLTCLLHFNNEPSVQFKFDVAIVTYDKDGFLLRIIHNKNYWLFGPLGQYTWNQVSNSHNVTDKVTRIKDAEQWLLVRKRYVELKNMYLCQNDSSHPSFIVYVEAVNEVYNQLFHSSVFWEINNRYYF